METPGHGNIPEYQPTEQEWAEFIQRVDKLFAVVSTYRGSEGAMQDMEWESGGLQKRFLFTRMLLPYDGKAEIAHYSLYISNQYTNDGASTIRFRETAGGVTSMWGPIVQEAQQGPSSSYNENAEIILESYLMTHPQYSTAP